MSGIDVIVISGRTSEQGIGLEEGKTSDRYYDSVALIELSPGDCDAMGVEDGQPIKVSSVHGEVVVHAKRTESLERGMAFFPYGPWANQIQSSDTGGTGMPQYKGFPARVEKADGEDVPSLSELVSGLRRGG